MRFNFTESLFALSYALDCVEHDLLGVTTGHSKRVAYISARLGQTYHLTEHQLLDLCGCAVLHDNALTEYISSEYHHETVIDAKVHCIQGEKNTSYVTFFGDVTGAVLYHHENADGSGALLKTAEETPLYAQLIHFADSLDAVFDLSSMDADKYASIKEYLTHNTDKLFRGDIVTEFLHLFNEQELPGLNNENIDRLLQENIPNSTCEYSNEQLKSFAALFARIIDYKSEFTSRHSMGIAEKAEAMAKFYGYDEEMQAKLYFAGALHDIGKLVVDRDVLEKPDKLTSEEYKHIQTHAYYTYQILSGIAGMEDITGWAALHHEKLDGSGYPFGKDASQLGKLERMMACLDIYQALTETRPYKDGLTHEASMGIIKKLVDNHQLDAEIVKDMDCVFG